MAKKKTLLIIPIVMIMTILISALTPICAYADNDNYEPRLTAPSSSSPYYSRKLNVYFQTGTPMPNCVAYAYGRIYELNSEAPKITHGSAGDWYGMNTVSYTHLRAHSRSGCVLEQPCCRCWKNQRQRCGNSFGVALGRHIFWHGDLFGYVVTLRSKVLRLHLHLWG